MKTKAHQWICIITILSSLFGTASPGTAAPTVFAIFGDCGEGSATSANCPSTVFTPDTAQLAVRNLMSGWNPEFLVTVGDNTYIQTNDTSYVGYNHTKMFDIVIGQYYSSYIRYPSGSPSCFTGNQPSVNKYFPVVGNHDWDFDNERAPNTVLTRNTLYGFLDYFQLPGTGVSVGSVSSGNERYYDFIQGPIHFFVISSDNREPNANTAKDSGNNTIAESDGTTAPAAGTQAAWLKQALAASTAKWKFVVFHHPPYTSSTTISGMRWPFQKWGADAVIYGHVHAYERLMHAASGSDPKIPFIISGLGGRSRDGDIWPRPTDGVAWFRQEDGALKATVDDKTASFVFFTAGGREVDSVYLVKTAGGGGTYDARIAASSDDMEEDQNGTLDNSPPSTDLEMVVDGTAVNKTGMRFQNVAIPKGSIIRKASVQFVSKSTSSGSVTVTIKGEAADNAITFAASPAGAKVSGRTPTTASVSWSPGAWNTDKLAGPDEQTPDLANIVQEIVNRSGWSSGNSMVLLVTGTTGTRRAYSYDNTDTTLAPRLHIEWDLFQFTAQPQSQIVNAGSSATFSVSVVGAGSFTYQWRKNGVNISGATSSSYVISSTSGSDAATYDVVVTGSGVSMPSDPASLAVITTQPQHKIQRVGGVNLTVGLTPSGTYGYQWYKDGVAISGANSSSLTVYAEAANAGVYHVAVSKAGYTSANSQSANYSVVTQIPVSQQVNPGDDVTFTITVVGPTVTYSWKKDGVVIPGETTGTLQLDDVTSSDLGSYQAYLTSGSAFYYTYASLTFNQPPVITLHPRDKSVNPGNTVSFTVAASGTPTLEYQWRKDEVNLSNGGDISGATTATLTIANVDSTDEGDYDVVVSNPSLDTDTSEEATLSVVTASPWNLDSSSVGSVNLGSIYAHVEQSDGKIVVGGIFGVARLNADGTADTGFASGIGGGTTLALAIDSSGNIYAGGSYAWYDYDEENNPTTYYSANLIRLTSSGSIDWSFYPDLNSTVHAVKAESAGSVLAGGDFTTGYGSTAARRITRLDGSSGYVDTSFHTYNNGVDSTVRAIVVQSDGKILVGGSFANFDDNNYSGWGVPYLMRLNSDGTLDTGFNAAGYLSYPGGVYALALQSDGKILVGGSLSGYYTTPAGVARLTSSGAVDTSFNIGMGANGTVYGIAVDSAGKIYLGGAFTTFDGITRNRLVRLTSSGEVDATLNPGTGVGGSSPAIYNISRSGNKFVISGNFTSFNGVTRYNIARFVPPGATVVPSGKVGWWQGENNADDYLGVNDGTANDLSYTAAKVNDGFVMDPSSGDPYVVIPASSSLDVGAANGFTVELWINPSDLSQLEQVLVEWNDNTGWASGIGAHLVLSTSPWSSTQGGEGSLYANIVDSTGTSHYLMSGPDIVVEDTWQHVALTYVKSSGVATIYLNGDVAAQSTLGTFTPETSEYLFLGARPSWAFFYWGLMDEVGIYNQALTEQQIEAIVEAGANGQSY